MKDFGSWVNEMAGTIEDANDFIIKHEQPLKYKERTALQIRMDFAHVMVGIPTTPEQVMLWMRVMTSDIDIDGIVQFNNLGAHLHKDLVSEYQVYFYTNPDQLVPFYEKLVGIIAKQTV